MPELTIILTGLHAFFRWHLRRPEIVLENHHNEIEGALADNPPATLKEALQLIGKVTGIKRSIAVILKFSIMGQDLRLKTRWLIFLKGQ